MNVLKIIKWSPSVFCSINWFPPRYSIPLEWKLLGLLGWDIILPEKGEAMLKHHLVSWVIALSWVILMEKLVVGTLFSFSISSPVGSSMEPSPKALKLMVANWHRETNFAVFRVVVFLSGISQPFLSLTSGSRRDWGNSVFRWSNRFSKHELTRLKPTENNLKIHKIKT